MKYNLKYIAWALQKEGERVRFSRTNRASMDSMRGLVINAPSKEIQSNWINKIEKIETKIEAAQKIIEGTMDRKEQIINTYLMKEESARLAFAAEPLGKYEKS